MSIHRLKKLLIRIHFSKLLLLFILGFPLYLPLRSLVLGLIPHWFDTAWGLLLGLENLEKIRLVGYPGGIPGIHYGPQWSWLLALVQLFNKNPVVITTVVLFIPYFTLFPLLLYKLKPHLAGVSFLWLAYILKYHPNTVHLWHIHLAPLLFLALIYFLTQTDWQKSKRIDLVHLFFAGFFVSLLIFIHMSFGAIMFLATCVYLGLQSTLFLITKRKQKFDALKNLFLRLGIFILGTMINFTPFIVFEIRHNFMQTKAIIYVLTQSFLYHSAVVGQVGLSQTTIWNVFFSTPINLLQLPSFAMYIFWLWVTFLIGNLWGKKQLQFSPIQKRLLLFITIASSALLWAYLSSKNPIWIYHFLGVEIIIVIFLGLLAYKSQIFRYFLILWVSWIYVTTLWQAFTTPLPKPLILDTLNTKKYVAESIFKDASGKSFGVYAYSSAIYTYDYDYLFKWLGRDIYHFEPKPTSNESIVYLIIPNVPEAIKIDFIHYKTPEAQFETETEWKIPEGTTVVKRIKIKKETLL